MSDIIQLLPDSVANQIAAGEVIQRPASVIKELVENAVDAKASSIQVILKDAGRTLIQVIDNGKGMSATDARLAFERHATSKIKVADDLFSLHTMGFRGEALASIAAIAQVELRTKRKEDEMGTLITLAASTVESQECVSCPTGSNFCVKNIFYNVPARRKFLKSNQVELSNIINEFERIALINPEVSFILKHNDNELFNLQPGNFRQRIVSIYGKGMNQQLLPLEIETSLIKISGYIGKPDFTVEPSQIDVNIHPTKTEIKFENEQAIWQIISATVKEALGKFSAVPSIDFDMTDAPDIPIFQKNNPVAPPKSNFNPSYNPFKMSTGGNSRRPDFDWNKLYAGFTSGQVPVAGKEEESEIFASAIDREDDELSEESLIVQSVISTDNMGDTGGSFMQIRGRYILTNVKSGLMIVDQYRAHVRILFDRYMSCIQAKQGVSQRTLFPEIIQLTTAQVAILQNIMADLQFLGFDLSDMGNNAYSVNGIPSGIEGVNIETLIWNMLETATEKGRDVKADIHERLALSLAEAAAIPYGQVLSSLEMEQLVGDLLASVMPNYTPDGKTVISILSNDEITKRFK